MLVTLVPLFDEEMRVRAYSVFTQKNNILLNPILQGTGYNDGSFQVMGLELIESLGLDSFTSGEEFFVDRKSVV